MKRVRISNERLNSRGTWVLTAGVDIEQYNRNPVLLYMHNRGDIIGYMKDVRVENGEITGEPVFDEATELSRRCKRQFEFGSLKMVSAALDIIEMSDEQQFLKPGQTSPTIIRSKLFEVSMVDIGSNDDAIVLRHEGKTITLAGDNQCLLPKLTTPKKTQEMDIKTIALTLGLADNATEQDVLDRLALLKNADDDRAKLIKEKDDLLLQQITATVDQAVRDRKINDDKRQHFINLGKTVGIQSLNDTLDAMAPQIKLSQVVKPADTPAEKPVTYNKFSEVPVDQLRLMRKDNPDEYRRLFRAEYGFDCEI